MDVKNGENMSNLTIYSRINISCHMWAATDSEVFINDFNIMLEKLQTNEKHDVCEHYVMYAAEENAREPEAPRSQRIKENTLSDWKLQACTYRLPSEPASFKGNQQNSEVRRDKEAKSHFHSHLDATLL